MSKAWKLLKALQGMLAVVVLVIAHDFPASKLFKKFIANTHIEILQIVCIA